MTIIGTLLLFAWSLVMLVAGGYIHKANTEKENKLLIELSSKAREGTDDAKAYILTTLSNHK